MAGEWLKFDASTPEKPEVFAITADMGWDDPDLTVGKLMRVWRWFDQHTIDGNAANVTLPLLDRVSGAAGFAEAMCNVGWLLADEYGLSLPHFDRHNGKTAKDRALTAKRVANHKAKGGTNEEGNADGVSDALPREEKRREEIKPSLKSKTEAAPRGTRLASDWVADAEHIAFCKTERPDLDPLQMQEKFRDFWTGVAGKGGVKLNWLGTWKNFIRSERMPPQARASPARNDRSAAANAIFGNSEPTRGIIDVN